MSEPNYTEAIRKLASAVVWLAQGTVNELGTSLAQDIVDKCAEALDEAGVEVSDVE